MCALTITVLAALSDERSGGAVEAPPHRPKHLLNSTLVSGAPCRSTEDPCSPAKPLAQTTGPAVH